MSGWCLEVEGIYGMSEWYMMCLDLPEGQVKINQVRTGKVRTGQDRCLKGVLRVLLDV